MVKQSKRVALTRVVEFSPERACQALTDHMYAKEELTWVFYSGFVYGHTGASEIGLSQQGKTKLKKVASVQNVDM